MRGEEVILVLISMMIFAGVAVLWMAMTNRRAVREMEHRERLAMIQHGVVPAPEADPVTFEAQMESVQVVMTRQDRWRTAGTITMGLGLALLVLLMFTGEPEVGFGVGGAFAILGAAFMLNGTLLSRPAPRGVPPMVRRPPVSHRPPDSSSSL